MLTLEVINAEQHSRFIKRIIKNSSVWALTTATGDWVFSDSNGEEEDERGVFLVWSDRAYAQRCATKEWNSYIPKSIPLAEFLEAWCAGLYNNQKLVGTNWNSELHGIEIESLALVLQILDALKKADKASSLNAYTNRKAFAEQIRRIIG